MSETVYASPSKVFFVSMLTRDIDLDDGVLDLLDNCVDGVIRRLKEIPERAESETPYEGYWAEIKASPEEFSILDNCGGIPKDILINSAFRLGRPDLDRDKDVATVGMYGIGMKRAMFKMGRRSEVVSRYHDDCYYVEIPPEWLDDDEDWNLVIEDHEGVLDSDGTYIVIRELHDNIKRQFDEESTNFLRNLKIRVSELFSLIIKKGFTVIINGQKIERTPLDILATDFTQDVPIRPYAYRATVDSVDIELVVGFYRGLASESEIEKELLMPRKRDNAGWTVICNDRIVLHRDKTEITGWGSGNVPKYHPQFITIAGIVQFSSTNSPQLPLNTTKRGLDMSSPVYWHAREYMMEGLKKFTDFTNYWKGRESETAADFDKLRPVDATEIPEMIPEDAWRKVPRSDPSEHRFSPQLPRPPRSDLRRRVSFLRLRSEVELLGGFYFDDPKAPPSDVGNRCFDDALAKAREAL